MKPNLNTIFTKKEKDIPTGWATGKIEDLINKFGLFCDGDWVESKDQNPNGNTRLIQLADIGNGYYRNKSSRYLTEEKAKELNCTFIKSGDLLIARLGNPLGKSCIFPGDEKNSVTAVDICIVRTGKNIIPHKWLMYFINSPPFRKAIRSLQSGTTRKRISRKNLAKINFPIPPLPEQHRIVAKIEELFTKLDAGIEALKKVKSQLKQYRQSVLKSAVEGSLTEEWREQHRDELEPANKLLEHILKERRAKWEAEQLAKYKSKGKKPPKTLGGKYKEPTPPDTTNLPELPHIWKWVTIEQISTLISGQHVITKNYNREGKGLPYLTGPADFGNKFPIISKWTEFPKAISNKDDILITVKGAGVGKINILNSDKSAISRQLMAIRSYYIKPDFMYYYLVLKFDYFQRLGQGSTVPGIDRENILNTSIPLTSIKEQNVIIGKIEKSLSISNESESIIKSELKRAKSLRQSILKQAFEGKLVPQDPNDEPASVLLERIKTEKTKSNNIKNKNKR